MKRSEMLKVIITELDKVYPNEGLKSSDIAHDILFKLQEAGMLPPMSGVVIEGHAHVTKYEWTKED